jgi:Derlin-2/3
MWHYPRVEEPSQISSKVSNFPLPNRTQVNQSRSFGCCSLPHLPNPLKTILLPVGNSLTRTQGLNIVIGGTAFATPLALAFITTSTIDSWGLPVSLLGLATFPSQYLPYAFLLTTLLISGPLGALIHGTGLVGAHLYDLLTGLYPQYGGPRRSLIATPGWMRRLWGTRAELVRPYGTVLNANAAVGAASDGVGVSAWGVGWGKWGEGQRLGGDAEVGEGAGLQRGRSTAGLAVAGFVLVSCVLGMVFMWYRDPEGWWTTIKGELFGGDMSGGMATSGV